MKREGVNGPTITRVRTALVRVDLEVPILYGAWTMRHREFVIVRVDAEDGTAGIAYCLTRDGPVSEIINRTIAPHYVGRSTADPVGSFTQALLSSHAVHAAGIGMRALSIVDVAAWDLAARIREVPVAVLLGSEPPVPMPATAIVGYPPSMTPDEVAAQVEHLLGLGWRRFKLPIAPDVENSIARLRAAREAAPAAWIGFDANMVFTSAAEVVEFEARVVDLQLGWIEDIVPPGDAALVARCRAGVRTPVAMGDEQGGSYHPEALLSNGAIDVLRIDVTTNGGVTRLRQIVEQAQVYGVSVAPHMYPHLHSRLLPALGISDAPIEWGVPGTGVHPMDDCLEQPVLANGMMQPLAQKPGFGDLLDARWLADKQVLDPEDLLADL